MAKSGIRNMRSSSRIGDHVASENCSYLGFSEKAVPRPTSATILGDITNQHNNQQMGKSGLQAGKPARPGSAMTSSSRPPLPEASRFTPRVTEMQVDATTPPTYAEEGADDPQCCAEYVQDIYAYLREEEESDKPNPEYMLDQTEISAKMRGILVDWLVEVHLKYKLRNETLFLTVKLIDLFLSKRRVARKRLQLVGVACTLVSAKFEEIFPPELRDLIYICDKAYTKDEILQMEIEVLTTVDFNLRPPTAVPFLDRFCRLNGCNESHRCLVQYLTELSLPEIKMIKYAPSHVAAAAVLLSNKLLKKQPSWPAVLASQPSYNESQVRSCAKELCTILEVASSASLQAVRKKFSHPKFQSVAKLTF
jgi:cyclin B